jgi:hypothetical protein
MSEVTGEGPAPRKVPYAKLGDAPDAEAEGLAVATQLSKYMNFGQGKLSARSSEAVEGDVYWATDDLTFGPTGTVYIWYGGAWHIFPLPTVVTAMLDNLAVTAAKLGNEAVESGKIKNLAVTETKLGEAAVGTNKLGSLVVTAAKIAANAIETSKIKAEAITEALLSSALVAKLTKIPRWEASYTGRVEVNFNEVRLVSTTRPSHVKLDFELVPNGSSGIACSLFVGGVQVQEFFAAINGHGKRIGADICLNPNETWEMVYAGEAAGAKVVSLHESHKVL